MKSGVIRPKCDLMHISELQPDKRNARKRTPRGRKAIETSLRDLGTGRSIVIDRQGRIIAGHGTVEAAAKLGLDDVQVVDSDGTKLIAIKRVDLDLDSDPKAQQLAIADNRASEFGEWDATALQDISSALSLEPFFTASELADITGDKCESANDAEAEWQGMPDYSAHDEMGYRQLIVHFRTPQDVTDFAEAIGQTISDRAKYIWYPRQQNADMASTKYAE